MSGPSLPLQRPALCVCCSAARQELGLPGMQSSPTLPLPQLCSHQDVPATSAEALQVFKGICDAQPADPIMLLTMPVRPSCASHCATGMEDAWQSLGALSSLSPAPSSPYSSCPCSSSLLYRPVTLEAVWHGQGTACSREKSLHGQQTTPLVSCSNLGMLSNVIGPFQPKDPLALVPGFGESPAAQQGIATPWDRQSSPSAQHQSYLKHSASRAQGWTAPSPLPSGLVHLPHTALQHPPQTQDASSFGDWFAGTD